MDSTEKLIGEILFTWLHVICTPLLFLGPPPSGHPRAPVRPHAVAPSGLPLRGGGRHQNITLEPIQGLHGKVACIKAQATFNWAYSSGTEGVTCWVQHSETPVPRICRRTFVSPSELLPPSPVRLSLAQPRWRNRWITGSL